MISERIEMEIIGFIGIAVIVSLVGVIMGVPSLIAIVTGGLGILGGYIGNQAKNTINESVEEEGS